MLQLLPREHFTATLANFRRVSQKSAEYTIEPLVRWADWHSKVSLVDWVVQDVVAAGRIECGIVAH